MLAKTIYSLGVGIATRTGLYENRQANYSRYFHVFLNKTAFVLDAGCGDGFFSKHASRQSSTVVSLDADRKSLKEFNAPNIDRICGDVEYLPFRSGVFDLTLCISLLEHLPNPMSALKEMRRTLKLRGKLFVQLPNLQFYLEPHTKLPLPILFPTIIKKRIVEQLSYIYINFQMTYKEAMKMFSSTFSVDAGQRVHHKLKTPFWPAAWVFLLQKRQEQAD
jgi:SAM-dependent methyltransferase